MPITFGRPIALTPRPRSKEIATYVYDPINFELRQLQSTLRLHQQKLKSARLKQRNAEVTIQQSLSEVERIQQSIDQLTQPSHYTS